MKTLSKYFIYIIFIIPGAAFADGLGGLAGLDALATLYIIMGTSAVIFIFWFVISIKYVFINKHYFNNLKIIIYIILSIILVSTCIVVANIIRSPESYLFYLCASIVIVGTLFSLCKIRQIRSLSLNE